MSRVSAGPEHVLIPAQRDLVTSRISGANEGLCEDSAKPQHALQA